MRPDVKFFNLMTLFSSRVRVTNHHLERDAKSGNTAWEQIQRD
jgi:hypothetical protein